MVWVSMIASKLALERLGRVGGNHLDRFEQRQAGLDAAHDDVDRVGKRLQKRLLAARLEKAQQPARQPEARGEGHDGRSQQIAADHIRSHESRHGENAGYGPELLVRPRQTGLRDPDAEGDGLLLFAAGIEFFQRPLDLLAARALAFIGLTRGGRLGTRDRSATGLGLPLARQQRIDEDPCQAADRGGGHEGQCERLHVHRPLNSAR